MKNITAKILVLAALLVCALAGPAAATRQYGCTSQTGGGSGALDAIDLVAQVTVVNGVPVGEPNTTNLADGDTAVCVYMSGNVGIELRWVLDIDGTDAELPPTVIRPDDYDTNGPGIWRYVGRQAGIDADGDGDITDETWYTSTVRTSGDQSIGGLKTFTTLPQIPTTTPTVDAQAASKKYVDDSFASSGGGDITGVTAGTGLSGGGSSGDVTVNLADTVVTPGSYTNADITVDQQGRITAASSGSAVGGDVYKVGTPAQYEWAEFTGDGMVKGTAVTPYSNVCTDSNGSPVACARINSQTPTIGDPDNWSMSGDGVYGGHWTANASGTGNLPAVAEKMNLVVDTEGSSIATMEPSGTDAIYLNGASCGAGVNIVSSGTSGDMVVMQYRSAGAWKASGYGFSCGS